MSQLYFGVYRAWVKFFRTAEVCFNGFWLGVLSEKQLHQFDELMYQQSAEYFTKEHNLMGLFVWETEALDNHFKDSRRLMLIGAGGGREVLALAERGIEVVGYECNPAMVKFATQLLEERKSTGTVQLLERNTVPPKGEPFDGVIIGWGAYMLIIGRKQRIQMLRALREQMTPDAPILLSFFGRKGTSKRDARIARVANVLRRLLRRPRIDVGDDLEPNYVHRFTEAEIREELTAAGFKLVDYQAERPGILDYSHAVGRTPAAD